MYHTTSTVTVSIGAHTYFIIRNKIHFIYLKGQLFSEPIQWVNSLSGCDSTYAADLVASYRPG